MADPISAHEPPTNDVGAKNYGSSKVMVTSQKMADPNSAPEPPINDVGAKNPPRSNEIKPNSLPILRINESSLDRDTMYADYNMEPIPLAPAWRIIPIAIYLVTMATSMVWIVAFGSAQNDFRGFCLLFGRLKYSLGLHYRQRTPATQLSPDQSNIGNLEHDYTSILTGEIDMVDVNSTTAFLERAKNDTSIASVDYINTSWGPGCMCNFCLYLAVASLFYSFLCCMFFSLCQIGRTQYAMLEHPSRLVLPALLLSFVFSLLTVVAAWLIAKGLDHWCQGIEEGPLNRCQDVVALIWVNNGKHIMNPNRRGSFYSFVKVAKIASWMTAICWVTCTMILMTRFFGAADFNKPKTPDFGTDSDVMRFSDSDYSIKGSNQNQYLPMGTIGEDSPEDDGYEFVSHTPSYIYKMSDEGVKPEDGQPDITTPTKIVPLPT